METHWFNYCIGT